MSSPYNQPELFGSEDFETVPCLLQKDRYERCSFCSSKLLFTHDLNLPTFEVIEKCRCPGCGVTLTPKKFKLH